MIKKYSIIIEIFNYFFSTVANYKERAQCIVNQYGNYTAKQVSKNVMIITFLICK